jgi:subtilase family serine protease
MGPYGEYIRATAKVSVWSELLNANFREFVVFYDEFENAMAEPTKRILRALEYSLPNFLVEHVEVVRNTIQVLPRRSLQPMSYEPVEFSSLKAQKQKEFPATKTKSKSTAQHGKSKVHQRDKDNDDGVSEKSNGDCPPLTFRRLSTGQCMSDVTVPTTINEAYGITDNTGLSDASQGVLSMITDNVSPTDLSLFETRFNIPQIPIQNIVGGHDSSSLCQTNQSSCAEPNLDVQYQRAMSHTSEMWRFFTEDPLTFLMNLTALDYPPMVNSISYGYLEPELLSMDPTYISSFDHEAMKLGLRGITIIAASGDDGVASFTARYAAYFIDSLYPCYMPALFVMLYIFLLVATESFSVDTLLLFRQPRRTSPQSEEPKVLSSLEECICKKYPQTVFQIQLNRVS